MGVIRWSIIRGQYSMRRKWLQAMSASGFRGATPPIIGRGRPVPSPERSPGPTTPRASRTDATEPGRDGRRLKDRRKRTACPLVLQKVLTITGLHGIVSFCVWHAAGGEAQNYLTYIAQHAIMGYNRPESMDPRLRLSAHRFEGLTGIGTGSELVGRNGPGIRGHVPVRRWLGLGGFLW